MALQRRRASLRNDLLGAAAAGALVVGFCLLLLWRDPHVFWNDDYQISILPVFADMARSWSEGTWPLLSPYSWVCSNLAGEFQYGTFSLFLNAAVVLIWKLPLSFASQAAALSLAHLCVLASGAYLLARDRRLDPPLALAVALVAALNGWIICWGATDWFGALGAFAWFPWAWWGLERAADRTRSSQRFLWPVLPVYLLITGGFPYTVLMLALLTAWLCLRQIAARNFTGVLMLLLGAALGAGLAAPAWLALLEYAHGSARAAQESVGHRQWVVPFGALPGFLLPFWTVNWADFSDRLLPHVATELASGLVPPVALIAGLIWQTGAFVRRVKWELSLLLLVLIIAMLPSANVFRWSFRWLPFLHLILALCAAEALLLLRGGDKKTALLAVALVALAIAASFLLHTRGPFAFPLIWILLGFTLLWAVLPAFSWQVPAIVLAVFVATYFCIPPNCGVPRYTFDERLTKTEPLDRNRLYLSIYPPPELAYRAEQENAPSGLLVRPGSVSMWAGLRLINGYSPIRPAGVARAFDVAIHGDIAPWQAEHLLSWEARPGGGLARLGVDGVLVARELWWMQPEPRDEWPLAYSSPEGFVYHRQGGVLPRVQSILRENPESPEKFAPAEVRIIEDSRQRVLADVKVPPGERSARLAFARAYFPGYHATLNGAPIAVTDWRQLNIEVELPPGSVGRLELTYRPRFVTLGGAIAAASLLLCGVGFVLVPRLAGTRCG